MVLLTSSRFSSFAKSETFVLPMLNMAVLVTIVFVLLKVLVPFMMVIAASAICCFNTFASELFKSFAIFGIGLGL